MFSLPPCFFLGFTSPHVLMSLSPFFPDINPSVLCFFLLPSRDHRQIIKLACSLLLFPIALNEQSFSILKIILFRHFFISSSLLSSLCSGNFKNNCNIYLHFQYSMGVYVCVYVCRPLALGFLIVKHHQNKNLKRTKATSTHSFKKLLNSIYRHSTP